MPITRCIVTLSLSMILPPTSVAWAAGESSHTVTIRLSVPEGTGIVYVAGNAQELGDWSAAGRKMNGAGTTWSTTLTVPHGTRLEFKFTLGSWNREALTNDGAIPGNHVVLVDADKSLAYHVTRFRGDRPDTPPQTAAPLPTADRSGVVGELRYHHDVPSRFLEDPRHVAVWLPPDHTRNTERRFPVLYMHDGQNLFDPRLAFTGFDWGVDEAIVRLADVQKIDPPIVVGIFNSPRRSYEYDPLAGGEDYARFLIHELKPMIDAQYRTLPDARHTGTMGSSAGGLVSIGLGWRHPDVFTRIGALSAHLAPIGQHQQKAGARLGILDAIDALGPLDPALQIYVDRGDDEIDSQYAPHHERLRQMLIGWGRAAERDFTIRVFKDARHTEADWRKRLGAALECLFPIEK